MKTKQAELLPNMFIPWHVSVFYLHKSCKDNYRFLQGPFKHLSWSPYVPPQPQTLCLGREALLLPVLAAPRGPRSLARPPPGAGLRPRGQPRLTGAAAQRREWEISGREGGRGAGTGLSRSSRLFKIQTAPWPIQITDTPLTTTRIYGIKNTPRTWQLY